MGTILKKYQVLHCNNIIEFKELVDAWNYADEHGLKRCQRFWEKDSQPYLRNILKGGEKANARPNEN